MQPSNLVVTCVIDLQKNYSKVKSRLFNYEQKGSSAESSTSKGAAGDAEMSTLAEARQISESRRAEREHGEALKSGDRMKKARNDSVHRPSDSLVAVSTGVPAKSSSEPPAASIVDGGAKKKVGCRHHLTGSLCGWCLSSDQPEPVVRWWDFRWRKK